MKDWIVGLDFDGVLWDSVGECFFTLRHTLEQQGISVESSLQPRFEQARWLVRTGGDFLLAYELARDGVDVEGFSKEHFDQLRASEKERLREFEPRFYAMREALREGSRDAWLASQRPYSQVLAQFSSLREACAEVVLMTTKDRASAQELLASAQIELPIWSRESGVDKGEQALDLCRQRNHPVERVILLDDLIDNLDQVRRVGARGALAGWGYNHARERAEAHRLGYPVVSADDLVGQLRGLLA